MVRTAKNQLNQKEHIEPLRALLINYFDNFTDCYFKSAIKEQDSLNGHNISHENLAVNTKLDQKSTISTNTYKMLFIASPLIVSSILF